MPRKFRIEIREAFGKPYLKVFLMEKSQVAVVKGLLDVSNVIRRCNIGDSALIVYPNEFYRIDEVFKEVEALLSGFLDGSILSETTKPQCATAQSKLALYPDAKSLYDKAIIGVTMGVDFRHALDDLRLSIETLMKRVLTNDKSMENQGDSLCAYLGSKGVSNEIVGNVRVNLTAVSKYFNEHEKHKDNVKVNEIDYIVTLVNNIINILL